MFSITSAVYVKLERNISSGKPVNSLRTAAEVFKQSKFN